MEREPDTPRERNTLLSHGSAPRGSRLLSSPTRSAQRMQDSLTDNGNHDHACAIGENMNADGFSIGAVHLIIVDPNCD